jgi:hypothetical protein
MEVLYFAELMSQDRFVLLPRRLLHLDSSEQHEDGKLQKIRMIVDMLRSKFSAIIAT